ncbi:MAG: hypothetical protein SNJ78_12765, partial [Spirochaetales bacterium]
MRLKASYVFLLVLSLFFIFTPSLMAQEDRREWYIGKPIRDIVFKGLSAVSMSELTGIIDPYKGFPFIWTCLKIRRTTHKRCVPCAGRL